MTGPIDPRRLTTVYRLYDGSDRVKEFHADYADQISDEIDSRENA